MNRMQRALSRVDLDRYARASSGVASAAEYHDLCALVHKVASGGRVTQKDVERVIQRNPHLDARDLANGAQWMNAGANAHERASRVAAGIAHFVSLANGGRPVDPRQVLEEGMRVGESIALQEFSAEVAGKLNESDAHRDRHSGIDEGRRIEAARRAAMQNPDAIRRADIERTVRQYDPQPTLYARDRRELVAQGLERNIEQARREIVRDADPQRDPARGDDRRETIGRVIDATALEHMADDELALAREGLDGVDDALTYEETRGSDNA